MAYHAPETTALLIRYANAGNTVTGAVNARLPSSAFTYVNNSDKALRLLTKGAPSGTWTTMTPNLGPAAANRVLALPPASWNPGIVLRIDLAAMRAHGIAIRFTKIGPLKVGNQPTMPGGGLEYQLVTDVPAEYIWVNSGL